jgi:hypothetical protein
MFRVSKNKSSVSWRHFSSHCGSSFLSVKLTVKIENISFKNPNSELISFDVVSLYTNIPHDLGISAITFWLENKRNIVQDRFSKEFILETGKIILERNVFYFDGKFYRQKRGTAMGTKMAPTYATLVLGYPEHILYERLFSNQNVIAEIPKSCGIFV